MDNLTQSVVQMSTTSLDEMPDCLISQPLSMLQKLLLRHMLEKLPVHYLFEYDGVTTLFQDFVNEKLTRLEQVEILLHKGGNAFFNHFMFALFYGNGWHFACDRTDGHLYSRNFFDPRGVHMSAMLMTFNYRLLYRYIVIRLRDHNVLVRGGMWYLDPKKCLWDGLLTRIANNEPMDRGVNRSIVMLESACRCMIHSLNECQITMCRCCDDLASFRKRAGKF